MRESHAHIFGFGEALAMPRLDDCASLRECLARVRQAAADARAHHPTTRFLRLTNARPEGWTDQSRFPTRSELDDAVGGPDSPAPLACVIMSFDYHSAAANSAALRAADLKPGDRPAPSGVVVIDAHTGQATGHLLEGAAYRAWNAAPEPDARERTACVQRALSALHALGFREVHDLHSQAWLGDCLAELERRGELALDVWLYPPMDRLEEEVARRASYESRRIRLAGGKLFLDGTLNSRTAMVLEPYVQPMPGVDPRGMMMLAPGELERGLQTSRRLGLGLAVHAIGDRAVRQVLDAVEAQDRSADWHPRRVAGQGPFPNVRIEHCELIDNADVDRFASLGVVCSVQPCHLLTDMEVLNRQQPTRLDRVLPLRELIESGCRPLGETRDAGADQRGGLWFGSDAPIVRPDPIDSIQAAVYRRRDGMAPESAIGPENCIDERLAWQCFGGSGKMLGMHPAENP